MSKRLSQPENRICADCGASFVTNWAQQLCNPCRYGRASLANCQTCGRKLGNYDGVRCWECRYGPTPEPQAMSSADRAWVAALTEGEGTFARAGRGGSLRVAMTDRDIIDRLHSITGVGTIYSLGKRQAHHRHAWAWEVLRHGSVPLLVADLAPLLLNRRRISAAKVLAEYGIPLPAAQDLEPQSDAAWAWVAGLIEGEGYIGPAPDGSHRDPRVSASSTDTDVLERLAELTGVGRIYPRRQRRAHWSPSWEWQVHRKEDFRYVLSRVLPLLGTRRTERALYALAEVCG